MAMLDLTLGVDVGVIHSEDIFALVAPGSSPWRSWYLIDWGGNVPPGLSVNGDSGYVHGTPTEAGTGYTILVADPMGIERTLTVAVIDPNAPDPEPPVETTDLGQKVADLMGFGSDPDFLALATEQSAIIKALVKSYTRGGGFVAGEPLEDVAAVIVTASARLAANPEQIAYQVGAVAFRGGFEGWSLAELAVLNRYRKRFA